MQDMSDIDALDHALDDVADDISPRSYTSRPSRKPAPQPEQGSFPQRLLRALATMAVRSKRRQADLTAAICRGELQTEATDLAPTLRSLEEQGFIEQIVPLYDGGMLVSVTSRGIEQLNTLPRWAMMGSN